MKPLTLTLTAAAGCALVAACTGYGPRDVRTGQTADEVAQAMGPPTARHALPQGGTRLEYARGPFGKHTYMVDLDPQGRVTSWKQVLNDASFMTVQPGWTQAELLMQLGRPSDRRSGGWQGGEVWSYRYDATFCLWFQVSVHGGRVTSTGYGPDPLCDVNDDRTSARLLMRR
jgi:outer membrane protein assembly factor BamE (lipoprotein component of BamABCDE complex)